MGIYMYNLIISAKLCSEQVAQTSGLIKLVVIK